MKSGHDNLGRMGAMTVTARGPKRGQNGKRSNKNKSKNKAAVTAHNVDEAQKASLEAIKREITEKLFSDLKRPGMESVESHPYVDSVGKITIGAGRNIDSLDKFTAEPMIVTATRLPATQAEKKKAHAKLRAFSAKNGTNYLSRAFKNVTGLHISNETIDQNLAHDLDVAFMDAVVVLGKAPYLSMHPLARTALVNMSYQLGRTKLAKYVEMIKAIHAHDYTKAAEESHIIQASVIRNDYNRGLFSAAAAAVKVAKAKHVREAADRRAKLMAKNRSRNRS